MSDLVVIVYPTQEKAEEVRTRLFELQKEYIICTSLDLIVSFLGSKPSSSDEERLEPFFSHRLTP